MIYMCAPNMEHAYCIDGLFLVPVMVGDNAVFAIPVELRERLQSIGFAEVTNPN